MAARPQQHDQALIFEQVERSDHAGDKLQPVAIVPDELVEWDASDASFDGVGDRVDQKLSFLDRPNSTDALVIWVKLNVISFGINHES